MQHRARDQCRQILRQYKHKENAECDCKVGVRHGEGGADACGEEPEKRVGQSGNQHRNGRQTDVESDGGVADGLHVGEHGPDHAGADEHGGGGEEENEENGVGVHDGGGGWDADEGCACRGVVGSDEVVSMVESIVWLMVCRSHFATLSI